MRAGAHGLGVEVIVAGRVKLGDELWMHVRE